MSAIFIDYLPAQLRENKIWYVEYYVKNPATGTLQRKCNKINRIDSIRERVNTAEEWLLK